MGRQCTSWLHNVALRPSAPVQVQPWHTGSFAALANRAALAEGAPPSSHRAAAVPMDAPAWPLDNLLGQVTDLLNAVSGILVTDQS